MKLPSLRLGPIRETTVEKIISLLLSEKAVTRNQLAEKTGVSLTTVGKVTHAMLREGIVTECHKERFESGRRAGVLTVSKAHRLLVVTVEKEGCGMTVLDPLGEAAERMRIPCNPNLSCEDNLNVYRGTFHSLQKSLEEQCAVTASALVVSRSVMEDSLNVRTLNEWKTDCLIFRDELIDREVKRRFGTQTVYCITWGRDLFPVAYVRGEGARGNPLIEKEFGSRRDQMKAFVRQWRAWNQIFTDSILVLAYSSDLSEEEEKVLKGLHPKPEIHRVALPALAEQAAKTELMERIARQLAKK
ncbi:MAG: hypothetical protein IJY47_02860 [Clostridia bacterium]|nr:hypothetical protein [Clostridia bacterium]